MLCPQTENVPYSYESYLEKLQKVLKLENMTNLSWKLNCGCENGVTTFKTNRYTIINHPIFQLTIVQNHSKHFDRNSKYYLLATEICVNPRSIKFLYWLFRFSCYVYGCNNLISVYAFQSFRPIRNCVGGGCPHAGKINLAI